MKANHNCTGNHWGGIRLWLKIKKEHFESKSQPDSNTPELFKIVIKDKERTFWKQITTNYLRPMKQMILWLKIKKEHFESKSQHLLGLLKAMRNCD